ncbi:MAG: hypothetical protein V7K86_27580 [Nostoc sp.]
MILPHSAAASFWATVQFVCDRSLNIRTNLLYGGVYLFLGYKSYIKCYIDRNFFMLEPQRLSN